MIRVFPRRTKWTPIDALAFVGDPPLFRPPEQPVKISVVFTWDIPEAERLYRAWSQYYQDVEIGGPAFDDIGSEFVSGRFVKHGITITSRGCSKECPFCLAWRREGRVRELPITPGWDVADNNLLACSETHIMSVFDMLREQPEPIKFSGGLDAELLQDWHVDLLKTIRLEYAWFACDYPGAEERLERISGMMSDFSTQKKRCYVLIGFDGESIRQAERRLERVYHMGFYPFAMLYQPPKMEKMEWSKDWMKLQKIWCRPAAFKAHMRQVTNERLGHPPHFMSTGSTEEIWNDRKHRES